MVSEEDAERYYRSMLNGLYGLQEDLALSMAPEEAQRLLSEVIAICRRDFEVRFLGDD